MKSRIRIILTFAAILGVISLVGAYRAWERAELVQTQEPILPAVRVLALSTQTHTLTESFYGLIRAQTRVEMAFQIPGRVTKLGATPPDLLEEGDRVERGQMIAQLEPQRYEAELAAAKARESEAQAAVATAAAGMIDAQARLDDAEQEYDRIARLMTTNATTQREFERSQLAVKLAKAAIASAEAQQQSAQALVVSAQAAMELAQVNLNDTQLLAPMDASVAHVHVELGQIVQPGQAAITLVDLDKVRVVIGVVERKLPWLKVGQAVDVQVTALSSDLSPNRKQSAFKRPGIVRVVPPAADVDSGLFNVEIELENPDHQLKPGMIAHATVAVADVQAIAIPVEAVQLQGDQVRAFLIGGSPSQSAGAFEVRHVVLEPIAVNDRYYFVDELPEGCTQLVVEGQSRIADGQRVQVVQMPLASAEVTEIQPQ